MHKENKNQVLYLFKRNGAVVFLLICNAMCVICLGMWEKKNVCVCRVGLEGQSLGSAAESQDAREDRVS